VGFGVGVGLGLRELLGAGVEDAFGVELFVDGRGFRVQYSGYEGFLVEDVFPTEEVAGAAGLELVLDGSGFLLETGGTIADDDFTGSGSGVFGPSPLQLTQ
jgi:hypothetical protein